MFKQSGAVEYMKSAGVFGGSKGGHGHSKRNFYNSFTLDEVTSDGFQGVKGKISFHRILIAIFSHSIEVTQIVNESSCPSLTWEQRLIGFCLSTLLGVALSVVGPIFLLFGDVVLYAILYSVGNVVTITSYVFKLCFGFNFGFCFGFGIEFGFVLL
jgi:hypothetical protein